MNRFLILLPAAVMGAAALAVPTTPGAPAAPASPVTHLVEKGGAVRVVDNPPAARHPYQFSPGDIVVVTRGLYAGGSRSGSLRLTCLATTPRTQHCTGTLSLAGGTLEVAGVSSPSPTTTVAVVGGTGVYAGAHGTVDSADRAHGDVADLTITLLS